MLGCTVRDGAGAGGDESEPFAVGPALAVGEGVRGHEALPRTLGTARPGCRRVQAAVREGEAREGGIGPVEEELSASVRGLTCAPTPPSTNAGPLADFLNYFNRERPHSALGGRPPISRTSGSDYLTMFDLAPEPLDTAPRQLAFEDLVEPTS